MATPIAPNVVACRTIIVSSCDGFAPSASRTPISRVRSLKINDITP